MRGVPLSRKAGLQLIDREYVEIVGQVVLGTGLIPSDATIPQISEGNEVFNFNYTPKFPGSKIILTSNIHFRPTLLDSSNCALFIDGAADAVMSANMSPGQAALTVYFHLRYEDIVVPDPVALINFQIRAAATTANTSWINTNNAGTNHGGTLRSWVLVEEFAQPSQFGGA